MVNARSALTAYSDRIAPRIVASVIDPHQPGNATISDTGMTGQITDRRGERGDQLSARRLGDARLPPCAIVRTGSLDAEIGVDLVQWGDIDDDTADNSTEGAMQWALTGRVTARGRGRQPVPADASDASPRRVGALDRSPGNAVASLVRQQLPTGRWRAPLLGADAHSGQGCASTRRYGSWSYDVDDTDPTTEPVSTLLHETSMPLSVPDSDDWQDLDLDVSATVNALVGRLRPNAVLVYVIVPRGSPELDIDDVPADGVASSARRRRRSVGARRCSARDAASAGHRRAVGLRGSHRLAPPAATVEVSTSPIGRAFNAASVAAPKEQPPRNLSGKRTAREGNAGK